MASVPLTFALQALLARHEAYMADAEKDRLELTGRIGSLELDKQKLEEENAMKIEENRQLLDQLEYMNTTLCDSDTKIKSLEASLLSSQQALRRLEQATARAEDAERHLVALEEDQAQLLDELKATKEESRSHSQRWKEAQRGILDMQDQLERMEKEARQERERHLEAIERMERQREVEKQLDHAAGRLKGAAASRNLVAPGVRKENNNVVIGHFVRDLLQDNANLQLGIAELKELLASSNDEIESLRGQLTDHQPIGNHETCSNETSSLKAELEQHEEPPANYSQELHIHHHYHVTPKQDKKPRKKRLGHGTAGLFTPPSSSLPPGHGNGPWSLMSSPTAPALLQNHTRNSSTATSSWGQYSTPASEWASSVPSSPRSSRYNSLFDKDSGYDSGPPMSPTTSFDPMSPTWRASHAKRPSAASFQSLSIIPQLDTAPAASPAQPPYECLDDTIPEEDEDEHAHEDENAPGLVQLPTPTEESSAGDSSFSKDDYMSRPRPHRIMSHESIMSLTGGLDIHTLKSRPSQMTLRPLGGAGAVVTGVTAQPTLSVGTAKRSNVALRENFAGLRTPRSDSRSMSRSSSRQPSPSSLKSSQATVYGSLGKFIGWRPWSGANIEPSRDMSKSPTPGSEAERDKDMNRASGINQPGAIPGFQKYWAAQQRKGAPAKVHPAVVDRDALNEGLLE